MVLEPLPFSVIIPSQIYCAVVDAGRREFIVTKGSSITQRAQRFTSRHDVPKDYAPVTLEDALIGVWCDPTKPELTWVKEPVEEIEARLRAESDVEDDPVVEDADNVDGIILAAAGEVIRSAMKP